MMTMIDETALNCNIFNDFSAEELECLFDAVEPFERRYVKGEVILREGEPNYYIRLMLEGSALASKNAVTGKNGVYTAVKRGNIFGDVIAVSGGSVSEVSVVAETPCRCLLIDYRIVTDPARPAVDLRMRFICALTKELSQKYFALRDRLDCVEKPTLRQKILCYLRLSAGDGRTAFLHLNREQLASYLCCDRSALCRELSAMKKEGIIDYYQGTFKLLNE